MRFCLAIKLSDSFPFLKLPVDQLNNLVLS